jgi:uncharacterized DUF497 family protein
MSYVCSRVEDMTTADWSQRGEYIAKRGMTVAMANEALSDPARVELVPDPASTSGASDRTIGYSETAGRLLVVITVRDGDKVYGANCWPANSTHRRMYREENQ